MVVPAPERGNKKKVLSRDVGMITQLEIKNFRGFSEYKIEDVGQVNLLVGTNNSGKTSILEAVQLVKRRGSEHSISAVLLHRGEQVHAATEGGRKDIYGDLSGLFYGFELTPQSAFSIIAHDSQIEKKSVHQTETLSVSMKPIEGTGLFDSTTGTSGYYQLRVDWSKGNLGNSQNLYVSENRGLVSIPENVSIPSGFFKKEEKNDVDTEFIYASSSSPKELVAMFDRIVLTPEEDLVLDAVRIIDPDIIRLASYSENASSSKNTSRGGILVKSRKWEHRIHIGSFGDGIWRLLSIILSLVEAKNGTLLIDEIDTGLHHTVMSKMWEIICTTAKKLNVQVFATTHSSDCWKTLADNAIEDEFADMPIRIHRIDKNKSKPETFTNQEMHLALDQEIEVR